MFSKNMSGYRLYNKCRFCDTQISDPVIDLGYVPLAGGFLKNKKEFTKEKSFPLSLVFCKNCYLLQTREVIPPNKLFKNYFYYSSAIKTLVDHFRKSAIKFAIQSNSPSNKLIVEIGCNDGTFIKESIKQGFRAVGIDPAENIVKPIIKNGLPIINDYFTSKTAKRIVKKYGQADIIFSSNTLAHIEDIHDVFKGIGKILKGDGVLVFENHYLGNLINQMQYDMIYHEHQYYYSLNALVNLLNQHDMRIFDVEFIPIHAGSISVSVQKKSGKRKIKKIVYETLVKEKNNKLLIEKTFVKYNRKIMKTKKDLIELLHLIKKNRKTIAGYGASGRGTIIMNYCRIGSNFLDYVIDDAPAKQGAYTPGNHLKIVSSDILKTSKKPDYILLFAWSFWEEIKKRNKIYIKSGGKFIVPLPRVKII